MIGGAGAGGGMLSVERLFRPEIGGADVRLVLPGGDFALLMFVVFVGDIPLVLTAVLLMFTGGILLIMLGATRSMLFGVNWFLLDVSDCNGMSFEFVGGGLALIAAVSVLINFAAVGSVGILLLPELTLNTLRRGMLFIFELSHPFFLRTVTIARETICHLLLV